MPDYLWDAADYARHGSLQQGLGREVLASLQLPRNARVLDVGCGDGSVTAHTAEMVPEGQVLGVDASEAMVQHAWATHVRPNLQFAISDARSLDFKADPFDLVISFACLHWLDHPGQGFAPIARHLKRGGRMLIQCGGAGNMDPIVKTVDAVCYRLHWTPYFDGFRFPWCFPEPSSCEPWLRQAGLTEIASQLLPRPLELPDAEAFRGWFRSGWRPYVERVPAELRERFVDEVTETYAGSTPIAIPMVRLQVEAVKR